MKRTIQLFLFLALAIPLWAQTDDSDLAEAFTALIPPPMVYSGPDGQGDGVVGAIPATVDVSALGGALYSIPIQVPKGINGIQPELSVVYNSQSGNGLLGWGWNIGGISAITRIGATNYHDGFVHAPDFGNYDRFALDGQRLVALNNASYGANGTEYKTEVDGMSKIVSYTAGGIVHGPARFKVWTADGLVLDYGNTYDSRLAFEDTNDSLVGIWLLSKVSDRNGNYMTYKYKKDHESIVVDRIFYTCRQNLSGCYSVVFDYASRNDVELSFIGDHPVRQKDLLASISVFWWEHEMWRYDFEYEVGTGAGSPDWYHRLGSITFSRGNLHYNPTRILWGERNHDDDTTKIRLNGSFDGVSTLVNTLKFQGDFNGDGLADFISVEQHRQSRDSIDDGDLAEQTLPTSRIKVYLNEGNTMSDPSDRFIGFDSVYTVSMTIHEMFYELPVFDTVDLISGLTWVYVCDFDGDGLDDFVLHRKIGSDVYLHAFRAVPDGNGNIGFLKTLFGGSSSIPFLYHCIYDNDEHLLTGDFMGRGRQDLILVPPRTNQNNPGDFLYFSFVADNNGGAFSVETAASGMLGKNFVTGDFNGDGKTEIWYAFDETGSDGKIVYVYKSAESNNRYAWAPVKTGFLNSDHSIYTGDFNGDGKTDMLTYNKGTHAWVAYLFKANDCHETAYDVGAYLGLPNVDPGCSQHSIEAMLGMSNYFQVADCDGDGKSDVVFVGSSLVVAYAPLQHGTTGSSFTKIENTGLYDAGLDGSYAYAPCVGDFLGQGTASLFSCYWLYSKVPMADSYSVDSITDGMGNLTGFEYGYLVYNPLKNDNIFSLSHDGQNPALPVYCRPLPTRALKRTACRNLHSGAPVSSVSYSYENALIHPFGRGFLGFAKTASVNRLGSSVQTRTIREFGTTDMAAHPFAVLKHEVTYSPFGVLAEESHYNYYEYQCSLSQGNKVFFPALDSRTSDSYDPGSGDIFRRTIEKVTYTVLAKDAQATDYTYTVAQATSLEGSHPDRDVTSATSCEFQTVTVVQYMSPDVNDWVVCRPFSRHATRKRPGGTDADVESLTVYEYGLANPFLVSKTTDYPGADQYNTNGLATSVAYEYDEAGNVTRTTLHALDNSLADRVMEYEYDNYRYKKKERNSLGYETRYSINYYQEPISDTDCNGLVTQYWCDDHLGLTNNAKHPDGTYGCSARRWAFDGSGNPVAHAPSDAAYYTWDRMTGEPPVMVFYDAAGRELRTVTEDMDGRAVYRDTDYDGLGRVSSRWEPYFANQQKRFRTQYIYDACHRVDTVRFPDSTYENSVYFSFAGLSAVTKELHARNGDMRRTIKKSNLMGWTTESVDNSGATVYYTHYPDGKLKKAGLNPDVEITMQYDDAGNRTDIHDPDYGHRHSTYNAFGELTSSTSPKGDVTEYRMDVLGRVVKRYDRDNTSHTVDSTTWVFGSASGEKGLLKSVDFNNGRQAFSYTYDTLCRLTSISEARANIRPYLTLYGYDAATGRINRITHPTGYVVKKEYRNGRLWKVKDAQDNVLWQTLGEDARGRIVKYMTGNQVVDTLAYNDTTGMLTRQYATKGSAIIQDFRYTYDDFRNLASRTEGKYATPMTETFRYDNLDRLDTVLFNNAVSRMVYDPYGRMTRKTSEGTVVFKDAVYNDASKPHAVIGADINSAMLPANRAIAYTMHDKVKSIQQGDDVLTIDYGYDRQRIGMTQQNDVLHTTSSKLYVGSCEFNHGEIRLERLTYLTGPMGVFAVYEELGPLYKGGGDDADNDGAVGDSLTDSGYTGALYYLHRDHLGSVTTVTNASGAIVQELSYDAWGNLRNPATWSGSFTGTPKFDRGYTGHEHLCTFGLINMNGRMYDPLMCCFLSVDTYVQDPGSPQNFNRYAYCLNNPLKYTDPDGEWVHVAIGALLGGVVNLAANWNNCDGFWQYAAAFGAGAANGALSVAAPGWGSLVGGAITGATNNLISQTGNNFSSSGTFNSGSFWTGVVSGAASGFGGYLGSSIGSLSIGSMNITSPALKSVVGGVIGGASGGFWGGFLGGMVSNQDVSNALDAGLNGAISGAAIGGVSGVANGIVESHANDISFWTGKSSNVSQSSTIHAESYQDTPQSPALKGKTGVEKATNELVSEGYTLLSQEITVEVNGTRVRLDIAMYKDGNVYLVEVKNGPHASFTPNQQAAYPQMTDSPNILKAPIIPRGNNAIPVWGQVGVGQPTYNYNLLFIRYY